MSSEKDTCDARVSSCYSFRAFPEDSSAGTERLGHIGKQGNSLLLFVLVEAPQAAARIHPDWGRRYIPLARRRDKSIAKVGIGRRLAVRLYWSWRNGCAYSPSFVRFVRGTARHQAWREVERRELDGASRFLKREISNK